MSEGQDNDGQEKSNEPTPARIEKARRDGDVPQSKEVNATASYIGFYISLALIGSGGAMALTFSLAQMFEQPQSFSMLAFNASGNSLIGALFSQFLKAAGPIFLLPAIGTLVALIAQRAIVFAPTKIKPKMSKLSIVSNAKKKYGPDGLVEFAKSATKLIIVFVVFGLIFVQRFTTLPAEALLPAHALPQGLLTEAVIFIGVIVIFSAGLAALDLPWMRHQHQKRLRMTQQDLKRESKENEGDPAMKQNRRARAQAIATNKMLHEIPGADVIIVNPTHYAVALKWDRVSGGAPTCIAKGVDEIALRIREIAATSGVPIRSDPPAARAIFATVELGEEVDREHYNAVAAAIHFADVIRAKATAQ